MKALLISFFCFWGYLMQAQSISQLTISPSNPGPNDSIIVQSSITYSGNCSYGLVSTYSTTIGDTIFIMPIYCGYGLGTICTSQDTFTIQPLNTGNYIIKVEYHQGSICPISNFDVTLGHLQSQIAVGVATGIQERSTARMALKLFPNPSTGNVRIELPQAAQAPFDVILRNILGQVVHTGTMETASALLNLAHLPMGVYTLEVSNTAEKQTGRLYLSY